MKTVRLGGLTTRIVGGSDEGPLVVLLHGFGAPGGDLVPLAGALEVPPGTRFAFPEAPIELPWGWDSRAWWHVDMERLERALRAGSHRDLSREVPEGLAEARALVEALIDDACSTLGARRDGIVLGGFSQGAMLACDVALRGAVPPAGVVLMSTTLLAEDEWTPRLRTLDGWRVFQSHGTDDPLLPFSVAEQMRDAFLAGGARHAWVPFRGVHEIPQPVLTGLSAFLRDVLG